MQRPQGSSWHEQTQLLLLTIALVSMALVNSDIDRRCIQQTCLAFVRIRAAIV